MNISIGKYLPHRPPMLMVDTITAIDDTSVVTEFFIKENGIFLEKGHLTEAGLIENMAQTCSAIVGQFFFGINDVSKNVIGYISAIKRADIYMNYPLHHKPYVPVLSSYQGLMTSSIASVQWKLLYIIRIHC